MTELKVKDPMELLAENKRNEIIKAYHDKYGMNEFILGVFYDYLKRADDKTIKTLKRGELPKKVKPLCKDGRPQFTTGMVFKGGKMITEEEYLKLMEEDKNNHFPVGDILEEEGVKEINVDDEKVENL